MKIGQIPLGGAIAALVELYALVNLLCYALVALAVGGSEGGIVTECATPCRERAVTVGTAETGIYRHLLHATAEDAPEVCRIGVEAAIISPWEGLM